MIKAIFFDVDGTLVSHSKAEVSNSTRVALSKLKEKGIQCVLATGRHTSELEMLPIKDLDFDGYITLNGQLCLDKQKAILHGNPITGIEKENIIKLFEEKRVPVSLVEEKRLYINFVNQQVIEAQTAVSTKIPECDEYTGNDIYLAVVFMEQGKEEELAEKLEGCKITRWNKYACDVISKQGGKVTGIKQYLCDHQIDEQETMAFGDGENDIEMLEFAHIGIAMGNADDRVKEYADYITADIDDDGIEKALKYFKMI